MSEQNIAQVEAEQAAHGWKTYTFAGLAIVLGIVGAYFGALGTGDAVMLIALGLVGIGLRDAQAKVIAAMAANVAQQRGALRAEVGRAKAEVRTSDLKPPTSGVR